MIKILRLEVPWYYFAKYWRYFNFLGTDVAKSIWQKCASRLKNVLKYIGNYFHVKETIKVFIFADKTTVKVLWKSLLLFISPSTEQSGRSPTWNNFRTIWVWNTVTLKTFFSFYIFLFFYQLRDMKRPRNFPKYVSC